MHDSKEMPMALPMFSASDNTEMLVRILSDVWVCRKSKIIHISPAVLLDPENVRVAIGILLLSGIQAEI